MINLFWLTDEQIAQLQPFFSRFATPKSLDRIWCKSSCLLPLLTGLFVSIALPIGLHKWLLDPVLHVHRPNH